jgi:hypothetical protein
MEGITRQLDGATNVLLEEPPMAQGRDACSALLLDQYTAPNVLFVTYTRQPADCLDQLGDDEVGTVGVITVGDSSATVERDDVVTENISTASDLTGLGIGIGQFLSEWESPTAVCFDSLTSMLQYVKFKTAYEFLHAITGQIHAADARAHFHIDPNAHDAKQVAGITSLFDARVSLQDDDVRTRDILKSSS